MHLHYHVLHPRIAKSQNGAAAQSMVFRIYKIREQAVKAAQIIQDAGYQPLPEITTCKGQPRCAAGYTG